jgi:hypothetical protein
MFGDNPLNFTPHFDRNDESPWINDHSGVEIVRNHLGAQYLWL